MTNEKQSYADFNALYTAMQIRLDAFILAEGLTMKKISHSKALSQETEAFDATIYLQGKAIATASNCGRGGETIVNERSGDQVLGLFASLIERLELAVNGYGCNEIREMPSGRPYNAALCRMDTLADRLLYTQYLRPKAEKSTVGRINVAWIDPKDSDNVLKVRWPEMHKLWKTDADTARSQVLELAQRKGWIDAGVTPVFLNDRVLGIQA